MSAKGVVTFSIASFVVLGGAWQLYCMTPVGAADRENARLQREMAKQAQQENSTQKPNKQQ